MVGGLLVALVGVVIVGWEHSEYGPGLDFSLTYDTAAGHAVVYEVDETESGGEVKFEGTMEEAQAYMDNRRRDARDYKPGIVTIAAGVVLGLGGAALLIRSGGE